jgi:hypothetical protein
MILFYGIIADKEYGRIQKDEANQEWHKWDQGETIREDLGYSYGIEKIPKRKIRSRKPRQKHRSK